MPTLSEQVLKEILVGKIITDVHIHLGYDQLRITLSDGSKIVISADDEWKYLEISHCIDGKIDNNIVI